jgi:uncharacterized membrane protein
MFMNQFTEYIGYVAQGIEYIGMLIVILAAMIAFVRLLVNLKNTMEVRREFAQWLLTGLEFVIAAEIILVTLVTRQEEVIILGAVVIIRVLLGYAILKEVM